MKITAILVEGLATGGYIGRIPVAPGTFGSLPGILFYVWVSGRPLTLAFLVLMGLIIAAVWAAGRAETLLAQHDPGSIVIDEIAGMATAFFAVPFHLSLMITGFIVFRVLDIAKPFPISLADRRLTGGVGVVADDVLAGIFTNILLQVLVRVFYAPAPV